MKIFRFILPVLAGLALSTPSYAAPWGTYFNMGTFGAGGGSDAEGSLNLECADPESGMTGAGVLFLLFTPSSTAVFYKKAITGGYMRFVVGSTAVELPMDIEDGSANTFAYTPEAETAQYTKALIKALRSGDSVKVLAGDLELANIALDGSDAALEAIDGCVMDGDHGQG